MSESEKKEAPLSEEQVQIRYRGRSTVPDGVYGVLKFVESDELYRSIPVRLKGIVSLAPFVMLRTAQGGSDENGVLSNLLATMDVESLALFRLMFEQFRENSIVIEKAINDSIIRRAVESTAKKISPHLPNKIALSSSEQKVLGAAVVSSTAIALPSVQPQDVMVKHSADAHEVQREFVTEPLTPGPGLIGEGVTPPETVEMDIQRVNSIDTLNSGNIVALVDSSALTELGDDDETEVPDLFG